MNNQINQQPAVSEKHREVAPLNAPETGENKYDDVSSLLSPEQRLWCMLFMASGAKSYPDTVCRWMWNTYERFAPNLECISPAFEEYKKASLPAPEAAWRGIEDQPKQEGPYIVPPFDPGATKHKDRYVWWSWHPRYPYWSKSCWGGATIEEAWKILDEPLASSMSVYSNKLVKEGTREVVAVSPLKHPEIWEKIFKIDGPLPEPPKPQCGGSEGAV